MHPLMRPTCTAPVDMGEPSSPTMQWKRRCRLEPRLETGRRPIPCLRWPPNSDQIGQHFELTAFIASFASANHFSSPFVPTTNHSFITRLGPSSNRLPSPAATRASTRGLDSLTTNSPFEESNAKILPLVHSAVDPNPFLFDWVTPGSLSRALTTAA